MDITRSALLTDLYQLAMTQAYIEHGKTGTAVFEFFARKLPPSRGFLIAAGLDQALDFLTISNSPRRTSSGSRRQGVSTAIF